MTDEQQEQYVQHVETIALGLTRRTREDPDLSHEAVWDLFMDYRDKILLLRAEEHQRGKMRPWI